MKLDRSGADTTLLNGEQSFGVRSLTADTLRGLKWTYLATVCSALLQIGVTATMSRLLAPAAFGVIAAAGLFLRFGSYFSEMGVGQALVQKPELSEEDIRAAFTASTTISFTVAAIVWFCAPLSLQILNSRDIVAVVRLLAVSLLINGLASTSLNLLRRRLRFDLLSGIEVTSYAISYGAIGIPLALAHSGIWALTAVLIAQPILSSVLAYCAVRHTVVPIVKWRYHKALLGYGTKISLSCFAEYIFFVADSSVVARTGGAAVLGLYNRASLLASLPVQNASTAMMKVLFPAFSRAQKDGPKLALAYLRGLAALALVSIPIAAGMVPAAHDLVLTLLGTQYESAASMVQILVIAVPFGMVACLAATVCNVKGEVGTRMVQQILLSALMWVAVWFAATRWGVYGVAIASVSIQGLRVVVIQRLAQRSLGITWSEIGVVLLPGVQLGSLVAFGVFMAGRGVASSVPLVRLAVEIGSAALLCLVFAVWCPPAPIAPLIVRVLDSSAILRRVPWSVWYRSRVATILPSAVAG